MYRSKQDSRNNPAMTFPFFIFAFPHIYVYIYTYIYIHTHHIFIIHSSVDGHLGWLHVLAIINSAAMNTGLHVFFSNYGFL